MSFYCTLLLAALFVQAAITLMRAAVMSEESTLPDMVKA